METREEHLLLWQHLAPDRDSVETSALLCLNTPQHADSLLQTWLQTFQTVSDDRRKTLLYVIWELCRQSVRRNTDCELIRSFWRVFEQVWQAVESVQLLKVLREFVFEAVSKLHIAETHFLSQIDVINANSLTNRMLKTHLEYGTASKQRFEECLEAYMHDKKSSQGLYCLKEAEIYLKQYRDCQLRRLRDLTGVIFTLSRELETQFSRLNH